MSAAPAGEPADPLVRFLDPAGGLCTDVADLPPTAALLAGYEALVRARSLNTTTDALVRQGELVVYPSSIGQEACQVAVASAAAPGDWLFPTYRDTAAVVARGVDPVEALSLFRGDRHCGWDPAESRVAPHTTPLATQLVHAVGVGLAARLRGEDTVALACCGDGATSEGDFHEALNLAAVFTAPVVFLVQNNGYAISVPLERQTAARTLADKGAGYGMPAHRVDGNDLAALSTVLDGAVRAARAGEGPTLVEAVTYRVGPHTNADDPGRYRGEDEVAPWRAADPLRRLRAHLLATGALTDDADATLAEAAAREMAAVRERLAAVTAPAPAEMFAHVRTRPSSQLAEQRELLHATRTGGG